MLVVDIEKVCFFYEFAFASFEFLLLYYLYIYDLSFDRNNIQ